ncbi:glycosyltransferase family 4 protein [Nocardioides nitrophenolicus]|uniref:glycosyltransferase family 4 protein n=1 Tax=Nocardioides nitrophenolicus TaxID=60489 RepID=UPI00195EF355|nr:glycosyltransferase family 4 protein [Nocardioides nitrophenolicus]MBM7519391.1 glycosyltransferase involved in cell wall biosynthesis [Nocardioides nitrophenolicus]
MTVGVNLVGDFSAVHGLAEASRRVVDALVLAGVDVSIVDARSGAPRDPSRRSAALDALPTGKRHPIDLVLLNVNEMKTLTDAELDRYTIGLWYWELLELDAAHLTQYDRVDEVWAASDLVAGTFRALGSKPVRMIPAVVPPVEAPPLDPEIARLPDGLRVLFTFDANSSVARKNPFACVEAFRRAFGPGERGSSAHLVVKALSSDNYPGLSGELAEAVASVAGTLISDDLPRPQMDALLDSCDIYLSLHRSEGFGLGMAEAMSLGKAVVATAFGGNTSFMTMDTAGLVGFDMREIVEADHVLQPAYRRVYRPGRWWAEPDVDQAAAWLRLLADDPDLRRAMGERAATHIREVAGPLAVGRAMATRLAEIAAETATAPASS